MTTKKEFGVFKNYIALKAHFSSDKYNYFENQGRTKATLKSFEKRRDKYFFCQLAKHKDSFGYLLSNIAYDDFWVGDIILNKKAEKNYKKYCRINQSLNYIFSEEIKELLPLKADTFIVKDAHPKLLQLYINNEISLETICLILRLIPNIKKHWDIKMEDDIVYTSNKRRIEKYSKFLKSTPKIKEIFKKFIQNNIANIENKENICHSKN